MSSSDNIKQSPPAKIFDEVCSKPEDGVLENESGIPDHGQASLDKNNLHINKPSNQLIQIYQKRNPNNHKRRRLTGDDFNPEEEERTSKKLDSKPERPRYFTRSKRRAELDEDFENEDEKRYRKIARAFAARILAINRSKFLETSFPAEVIAGIRIPKTYNEAVNDATYGKEWKAAMLEEIISLGKNGTWKEVIPPKNTNLVSTKW
ncbi:hypothetical protein K3495_g16610, partial [Podosphaera aphanis]